MNTTRIVTGTAMLGFAGASAWMMMRMGVTGWIGPAFANPANIVTALDLLLALSVCVVWTWADARRRGINPLPYAVLTYMLGSIGPLLYLFHRAGREHR
ncbi:MAG: DUF2834 domain-containing protein [Myxococcota bacterium]